MIEIKDLLSSFESLLAKGEIKNEIIRDAIKESTGLDIKKEDIKVKNGTLYLNIKPIYKNEIFMKKEKIISILNSTLGNKSPGEIR